MTDDTSCLLYTVSIRKASSYLSGVDSSLHNGEVISVQNGVHVRNLSSVCRTNKAHNRMDVWSPLIPYNQCECTQKNAK